MGYCVYGVFAADEENVEAGAICTNRPAVGRTHVISAARLIWWRYNILFIYPLSHYRYRCEVCGKTFNFHHSLKLHSYKHTGRRPYPCDQCSKAYLTASHLKDHVEAVHSGERKFKCEICDKSMYKMLMFIYCNRNCRIKIYWGPQMCLIKYFRFL